MTVGLMHFLYHNLIMTFGRSHTHFYFAEYFFFRLLEINWLISNMNSKGAYNKLSNGRERERASERARIWFLFKKRAFAYSIYAWKMKNIFLIIADNRFPYLKIWLLARERMKKMLAEICELMVVKESNREKKTQNIGSLNV